MTKKGTNKYHWYVEPTGSDQVRKHTNEVIASDLASHGKSPSGAYSAKPDHDGAIHQVWELTENEIARLNEAKQRDEPISFDIFGRADDETEICPQHPIHSNGAKGLPESPRRGSAFHKATEDLKAVLKARKHAARKAALTAHK